jgi:hypothetical protein
MLANGDAAELSQQREEQKSQSNAVSIEFVCTSFSSIPVTTPPKVNSVVRSQRSTSVLRRQLARIQPPATGELPQPQCEINQLRSHGEQQS